MEPRGVLETVLYAGDLEAAEGFYTEVLGLGVFSRERGRHVFFRSGQGMFLIFNPGATSVGRTRVGGVPVPRHGARGPGHAAFRVPEAELPEWRERLRAKDVAIEAEITWPAGGQSVYFRDPAGNSVDLGTAAIWGLPEEE